jgi:hypothetical protein
MVRVTPATPAGVADGDAQREAALQRLLGAQGGLRPAVRQLRRRRGEHLVALTMRNRSAVAPAGTCVALQEIVTLRPPPLVLQESVILGAFWPRRLSPRPTRRAWTSSSRRCRMPLLVGWMIGSRGSVTV